MNTTIDTIEDDNKDGGTLEEALQKHYGGRNLQERSLWYKDVARSYSLSRPTYPSKLMNDVFQSIKAGPVLELGSGPGTATQKLCETAFITHIHCVEPNPSMVEVLRDVVVCASHQERVTIHPVSFEEYFESVQDSITIKRGFKAIVAATSFHWISPDVALKQTHALIDPDDGCLVLLWNKEVQLESIETYERVLQPVFRAWAPQLDKYETPEAQFKVLHQLQETLFSSNNNGYFDVVKTGHQWVEPQHYSIELYLQLLTTYSGFIRLTVETRDGLLDALQEALKAEFPDKDEPLPVRYLSAYHMAKPRKLCEEKQL
mmetsp:Transcript_22318/g.34098  ORF Transcript_22318/g.34098 Transcript_22318/m.34098 type:complete len:317 (+) Transcript_22318:122-1072(+)